MLWGSIAKDRNDQINFRSGRVACPRDFFQLIRRGKPPIPTCHCPEVKPIRGEGIYLEFLPEKQEVTRLLRRGRSAMVSDQL